jgi:DNA invertase Pin-like site-specific DNA recombinase
MNTKHRGRYVAYYRVSTTRQGRSGLGLEAQRQAVGEHLNGGNWKLVAEFTEVESGKRADRPRLSEALKACRLQGAKLIIAKLDRLARNVAFISNLITYRPLCFVFMIQKLFQKHCSGGPQWEN